MANSPGMLEDHAEFVFALVGSGASYPTIAKKLLAEHNVKTSGRNISSWAQRRLKKIAARRELLSPLNPLHVHQPISIAAEQVPVAAVPASVRPAPAPQPPSAAAPAQPLAPRPPVVAGQPSAPVPPMTDEEREAKFAEIQKVAERGNRLILRPKAKPAQTPTSPPPAVL